MQVRWTVFIFLTIIIPVFSSFRASLAYAQQSNFACNTVTEIPQEECESLVTFYNSTNGSNWLDNSDWLVTDTVCNWHGVVCTSGHIETLKLPENKLKGNIPPELAQLTQLKYLELQKNDLRGSIPAELGQLIQLKYLNLSLNKIEGHIPPELGNLANLETLDLSWNALLSGTIPPELSRLTHLETLALAYTRLSGNIPAELGQLIHLKYLHFDATEISGNIPPELGNLANLEVLSFLCTSVSGNVPPELGQLTRLKVLDLSCFPGQESRSLLTGPLPLTLVNLKNLERFWFYNDRLCVPADETFQTWLNKIFDVKKNEWLICDATSQLPETGGDWSSLPFILMALGFLFLLLGGRPCLQR